MREVNIYVKSSIKSTRKRDGYIAYVLELITDKKPVTLNGFEKVEQMTSNQSELAAITKALKRMNSKCVLTIYTDSKYIGSAVENNWIEGWQKKNWVNAKNEPIANAKEWQNLLKLLEGHKYSVVVGFKHEYASWMKRELDKKNDDKA